MFSLSDIFTPSFFIILAIIVMLFALLIVYIENKWSDQNHKIASMLSLVSSLAEEMNGLRFHLMNGGTSKQVVEPTITIESKKDPFFFSKINTLIEVSDNEEDIEDEDEDDEDEDDEDDEDEDDEDEDDDEDDEDDLKTTIFNLNISEEEDEEEKDNLKQENIIINLEPEVKVLKINDLNEEEETNYISDLETLESASEEKFFKNSSDLNSDLKSISFSLEEEKDFKNDNSKDLKKAPLSILRSLVMEKKLMSDPSKLKKHELLKLLEIE